MVRVSGTESEPLWFDLVEQGQDRGDRKRCAFPLAGFVGSPSALSRMPKLEPHGDENSCGGNSGAAQGQGDDGPGGITAEGTTSAAERS